MHLFLIRVKESKESRLLSIGFYQDAQKGQLKLEMTDSRRSTVSTFAPAGHCEEVVTTDKAISIKNEIAAPFRLAMTPFSMVANVIYFMPSVIKGIGWGLLLCIIWFLKKISAFPSQSSPEDIPG